MAAAKYREHMSKSAVDAGAQQSLVEIRRADKTAQLHALGAKIERHWTELNAHLDAYCKVIGEGASGVPVQNIRMMYDGRSHCLCFNVRAAISEQLAAMELEAQSG